MGRNRSENNQGVRKLKELRKTVTESGLEITHGSGNVFADLGFPEEEAENLLVRSQLMSRLIDTIRERGWSQKEAADRLGVHQPRVSLLMRGKIGEFSVDTLISMLGRAGLRVMVDFEESAGVGT